MADFGLNTQIPLGAQGAKRTSLGELLGTATKAMEFEKLSELYPSLIKKAQTETASAEFDLTKKRVKSVTDNLTSTINDPVLLKLEADPNSIPQQDVVKFLKRYGDQQAQIAGIPREQADQMLAPYYEIAQNNPGQLRSFFKSRLIQGLDDATKVSTLGGAGAIGVSTIPPNQPAFKGMARPEARQGVTPEAMTAPIGAAVSPVPQPEVQVAPIAQRPVAQPSAQPQAAPMMAQDGRVDAGFALPYEPPRPGIPRATTPSETTDLATGQKYRTDLLTGQATVPKAARNVDAVLSGIKELEKDRRFTTGPLASREQYIKEFFGDERFKQLSKDIANVEIATLKAQGFSTDADKSLNARANGDETYPPSVLLSVANRLAGDLTRLDMEAKGAQKFAQQFGDSNLPAYRQAWAANADQKIFEAMFLQKNERDPKRQKQALDKILPTSKAELSDFLTKYENIKRLTETGRLK